MDGIIRIKIPEELKEQYQQEKYLLEKIGLEISAYKIEKALEEDYVSMVLGSINDVTTKRKNRSSVAKTGFFINYPDWLDFALLKIIKGRKIDIGKDLKKEDIYNSLFESQHQLFQIIRDEDYNGILTRSRIINEAEQIVIKENKCKNIVQINQLCSLFIDIGLNNQDPEKLADFSYKTYRKTKK